MAGKERGISTRVLGQQGEDAALSYLKRRHYVVLSRNFSCPFGEIDLICLHKGVVVFIEVKARRRQGAIRPEDSVGRHKRRRLIRCALYYLQKYHLLEEPCRFDIVSVYFHEKCSTHVRIFRDCIWELEF